jgi:alpha-tubulin suppressor-like RCC1 family protein
MGSGAFGQIGNGSKKIQGNPVQILKNVAIVAIASGQLHSLALSDQGKLFIWGYVSGDHLGLSESGDEHMMTPIVVEVKHLKNKISKIFAGGYHSALLTGLGSTVIC